jgi:uncharacterized protein (TIGR02996 family)
MPTEDELLAQIKASPDDDGPRLVYADWLTAAGDPRGELIVLGCRLAAAPNDDASRKLKIAENKLLKQHGKAWADLPGGVTKYVFRRGFVDEVEMDYKLLADVDALFVAAPLLRSIRLDSSVLEPTPEVRSLAGLLASPRLAQLTALDVRVVGIGDAGAREIASSPRLGNLTSLRLSGLNAFAWSGMTSKDTRFGAASIEALARAPTLRKLRHLTLSENHLTCEDVAPLGRAPWELESLELGNNNLLSEGVRAIAGAPFGNLRHLGLSATTFDDATVRELASSKTLGALESLDLERGHLGPRVALFLTALALPNLRTLRLERNRLGDSGAIALGSSPSVSRLTSLEMGHNLIGKKGAAAIASSPHLTGLRRLTLNEPRWKEDTIDVFRKSKTLAGCLVYMKGHPLVRDKS